MILAKAKMALLPGIISSYLVIEVFDCLETQQEHHCQAVGDVCIIFHVVFYKGPQLSHFQM
jgi:hypothetical protein